MKTQPLDPSVLFALENKAPAAPKPQGAVAPTTPLNSSVLLPDALGMNTLKAPIPAQGAMFGMNSEPQLSETEAGQLLELSSKLADLQRTNPVQAQATLDAVALATQNGRVHFGALTADQQSMLAAVGLTQQNTAAIFQQLHQLMLPTLQGNTSDAFQSVQSSVSSFLSNVDLKQQTFHQIERQAQDLSRVQGVVSSLSASSINDLLADQTNGVYDISVSQITSQNFDIRNDMDFTLGHFVVQSQENPDKLQAVESTLKKLQSDQPISSQERQLLNNYGLNVNSENKLETSDRRTLSLGEVQKLESVLFSMTDPSEGYQKVLKASADVIKQSRKLEALASRAQFESQAVQVTTTQVVQQTQELKATQQEANQLDVQLQGAKSQAEQLATFVQQNTNLTVAPPNLFNTAMLARFDVRVKTDGGQSKFFIGDREATRLEVGAHLSRMLEQQRSHIKQMAGDLAQKKTDALIATANLAQTTQKLETQTTQLEATQNEIKTELITLKDLQLVREQVVADTAGKLKPEEQKLVDEVITPEVEATVAVAKQQVVVVQQQIQVTLAQAHQTIEDSHQLQASVKSDAQRWEQTLNEMKALDEQLEAAQKKLDDDLKAAQKEAVQEGSGSAGQSELSSSPKLARRTTGDETSGADGDEGLTAASAEQQRSEKMLERQFLEQEQAAKEYQRQKLQAKQVEDRFLKDQQIFKQQIQEIHQSEP